MATGRQTSAEPSAPLPHSRTPLFLQRKCACGGTPGPSGECEECRKKKLSGSALQPKLKVGAPDDRFEREADRVAERVTSGAAAAGPVAVQPVSGTTVHRQPDGASASGTSLGATSSGVPSAVHRSLDSGGRSLPDSTREHFESRFGHDFSKVRIHTDQRASEGASAINARAFTSGSHIVFGAGQFAPQSSVGQKLLAHELTHVLQQRSGVVQRSGLIQRACEDGETEHTVVEDDSLWKLARAYGTTVEAIKKRNGLESDIIHPKQVLCIPGKQAKQPKKDEPEKQPPEKDESKPPPNKAAGSSSKCPITIPSDVDTQHLAGVIFAEADGKRTANDERRAIGWSFVNTATHTAGVCDGSICTSLKQKQREFLCKKDKRDLGETVLKAIKIGSKAYGGNRWKLVMDSDKLKTKAQLCTMKGAERDAIERAIKAAVEVKAGTGKVAFLRFNRAKNQPPGCGNPKFCRFVKADSIAGHTFYSFKKDDKKGRCLI